MSKNAPLSRAAFISPAGDPGRPAPLEKDEYDRLAGALEAVVAPVLESAARALRAKSFIAVRVDSQKGMIALSASHERPNLECRLRFRVHDTFGVLATREPVFWMFSIYRGTEFVSGKPGRMDSLEDAPPIQEIAAQFVTACDAARHHSPEARAAFKSTVALGVSASSVGDLRALLRKIRPSPGLSGWTQSLPNHPLPPGLPDREAVCVISGKYDHVNVRTASGREWRLARWNVDCGAEILSARREWLPEYHPAAQALIRRSLWETFNGRCKSWLVRRTVNDVLYLLWVLARNGADVSEFAEPLADLEAKSTPPHKVAAALGPRRLTSSAR